MIKQAVLNFIQEQKQCKGGIDAILFANSQLCPGRTGGGNRIEFEDP